MTKNLKRNLKELPKNSHNFEPTNEVLNLFPSASYIHIRERTLYTVRDCFQKIFSPMRTLSTNHIFSRGHATLHLAVSVGPSVGPLVGPSVGPLVGPSVGLSVRPSHF